MKKIICITLLLLPFILNGQNLPLSNYQLNMVSFNPAFAGSRDALSLNMFGRIQWLGFAGNPNNIFVSVHTPFSNDKVGFGGDIRKISSADGALSETGLFLNYSYRIWLKGGRLAFGLKGGFANYVYNESRIETAEPDPYFSESFSKLVPNFGAGILYYNDTYFAGFSIPEFLTIPEGSAILGHDFSAYHFILTGGYNFNLSEYLQFRPTAYINYSLTSFYMIASANFGLLDDLIWTGLSYKSDKRFGLVFNVQATNSLLVGYAVDFSVGGTESINSWSHEIVLRWEYRKMIASDNPFYY